MSNRVLRQDISTRTSSLFISSQADRKYMAIGWTANFSGVLNELDLWMNENTSGTDTRTCNFELWSSKVVANTTPNALLATSTTTVDLSTLDANWVYKTIRGFNYRVNNGTKYYLVAYASLVQATPCASIGYSTPGSPWFYSICYSSDKVTWVDNDNKWLSGNLYQYTAPFPQARPGSPVAT